MTRADLLDDDPITLAEASKLVLRGRITVSALRAEIRRGTLTVERIGKNLFTTPAAIREMREKCRVMPNPQDYTSGETENKASGSSETGGKTSELAALKASVRALKSGSLSTLRKSTPHLFFRANEIILFLGGVRWNPLGRYRRYRSRTDGRPLWMVA